GVARGSWLAILWPGTAYNGRLARYVGLLRRLRLARPPCTLISIQEPLSMIRSMTAFGSARAESDLGSVSIEFRSVNSRYLDVNFRLPEDLRMAEGPIRELLGQHVRR